MTTLSDGYTLRPPTPEDRLAVAALLAASDVAAYGEADTGVEYVDFQWNRPGQDAGRDSWLVCDPKGDPAGYAIVWNKEPGVEAFAEASVHPAHRGRGIGSVLIEHVERRFGQMAGGGTLACYNVVYGADGAANDLLAGRGYRVTRRDWRMSIDLSGLVAPAVPPETGASLVPMDWQRDARGTHEALMEAFREHRNYSQRTFDEWVALLESHPGHDPSLWTVARDGDVVGGAAAALKLPTDEGFIPTLGVRKEWRGRGIGDALLRSAFAMLYARGARRVTLDVDSDNTTGAARLYERAGMRADREYVFYRKDFPG